jgi:hypothetical protein
MARRHRSPARASSPRGPAPPSRPHQRHEIDCKAVNQAERRPLSGQEDRDGARSDPSRGQDPHSEYQQPNKGGPWLDGLVFVAILATGVTLVTIGHLTVAGLAAVCTALVGLFGAWVKCRTKPPRTPES